MSAGPVKRLVTEKTRQGNNKAERHVLDDETQQDVVTTVDLLEELEAEFVRLRAQNRRLSDSLKSVRKEAAALKRKVESLEKKAAKRKAVRPIPQVSPDAEEHREKPAPKRKVLGKSLAQLFRPRRGVAESNH